MHGPRPPERRLGLQLVAPAFIVMILVTAYPLLHARLAVACSGTD